MSAARASAATFYHVGIVTADIEDAVEKYSNVFDLTFAPILTSEGVRFTGAYEAEHDIRWVFSIDGPPYIEFVEGQGDGFLSAAGGDRIHHIGRWAPKDQIAAVKSRVGEVITIDRPGLDGNNVWFADPSLFRGIWIEMIDEGTQGEFEAGSRQPGSGHGLRGPAHEQVGFPTLSCAWPLTMPASSQASSRPRVEPPPRTST